MTIEPEASLFRAVIAQAFVDALLAVADEHDTRHARYQANELRADRDHARAWLLNTSADMQRVCDAAGIPATDVITKARELEQRGWPTIEIADTRLRISATTDAADAVRSLALMMRAEHGDSDAFAAASASPSTHTEPAVVCDA